MSNSHEKIAIEEIKKAESAGKVLGVIGGFLVSRGYTSLEAALREKVMELSRRTK